MTKLGEDEAEMALRRLAAIPGFSAEEAKAARIDRLPGLSNGVFRVETPAGRFVLRIPRRGAAAIVNRRTEEVNARAAAAAGIAPEVMHFGADGVMLTRFVEGEALSSEGIVKRPGALERVGVALRRLHESGIAFAGRFEAFATIDAYAGVLSERGVPPTARQREILAEAEAVRDALAADPPASKPCHCDPTGRNLIDTSERVWLVDWEYSAMNDPAWDIAYCSVQNRLAPAADATLLSATFGRKPERVESARIAVMKAPVELMSALWALIQENAGNRAADFSAYAEQTFALAAERMRTPDFGDAMRRLRGD